MNDPQLPPVEADELNSRLIKAGWAGTVNTEGNNGQVPAEDGGVKDTRDF